MDPLTRSLLLPTKAALYFQRFCCGLLLKVLLSSKCASTFGQTICLSAPPTLWYLHPLLAFREKVKGDFLGRVEKRFFTVCKRNPGAGAIFFLLETVPKNKQFDISLQSDFSNFSFEAPIPVYFGHEKMKIEHDVHG